MTAAAPMRQEPQAEGARFLVRSPLLAFDDFVRLATALQKAGETGAAGAWQCIDDLLDQPLLAEAIAVASADFTASLDVLKSTAITWRKTERILQGLLALVARMSTRCTPVGLSAGWSTGSVTDRVDLRLPSAAESRRVTLVNVDYVEVLARALARIPDAAMWVRYGVNSSLWVDGLQLRYYRTVFREGIRMHVRTVRRCDNVVLAVLADAREPTELRRLIEGAAPKAADIKSASSLIQALVDEDVLVPDLLPTPHDRDPLMSLVNKLERLADQSRSSTLRQVTTQLRRLLEGLEDLDSRPVGGGTINHLQIARHLARSVPGVFPEKAILRVDLVKRASGLQFSEALVREIARGARIISLVSRRPALEKALDDFKMRFRDLYEDHEVPLLEALDEEVGIPFQTYGTDAEEDRAVPSRRHRQLDRWLATKLGDALAAGRREIELAPAELERHLSANQAPVAPSYAAVISVGYACAGTQRVDRFDVLMKNVIRPAAAGLARFEHHLGRLEWNTDRPAQAAGPLPVDILHFPQGTLSSAMLQPRTDRASVSYMAGRPPTSDLCISPDDLLLSVKGGRIVVRSESLNREIVPRLSCQHNFPQNGVPFYRFLCSLQQPAGAVDRWEWGPLIVMPFLPRVRSGSVILSRARWTLGGDDLDSMRSRDAADREQWFTDWADRNGIPRYVYLLDGMRELLIDRQNQLSLSYVLRAATARRLTLVEMLPGPEQLALWGHEGRYLMEAVIPFEDGGPNQQIGRGRLAHQTQLPTVRWRQQPDDTPRNYPPGSRWLFVKVYCAPSIQDAILSDLIVPFAERSISSGLASRWFFVRYRDPGPHLRLRFLAGEHSMALLAQITQELATPQAQGIIKRVVIDTYEPEVTRYGGPAAIDHAEEFFWRDSEAIGAVLPGLKAVGSANPDSRWVAGLWNADLLVSAFRLTPMEQKTFVRALRDSTRIRFRTDDATSHELSYWARQNREALSAVARGDRSAVATLTITPLDTRQAHVRRIVDDLLRLEGEGQLLVRRSDLFMSLLHMSMNRLLPLDAPHWEAAVYELLDRTMQMRFARQEVQKP